jgi:hypothetical protein
MLPAQLLEERALPVPFYPVPPCVPALLDLVWLCAWPHLEEPAACTHIVLRLTLCIEHLNRPTHYKPVSRARIGSSSPGATVPLSL